MKTQNSSVRIVLSRSRRGELNRNAENVFLTIDFCLSMGRWTLYSCCVVLLLDGEENCSVSEMRNSKFSVRICVVECWSEKLKRGNAENVFDL